MNIIYKKEQIEEARKALASIQVSGENNVIALAYAMQILVNGEIESAKKAPNSKKEE